MSVTDNKPSREGLDYTVRPTTAADTRSVVEFQMELAQLEPTGESDSFDDYMEWFSSPFAQSYTRWQAHLVNPAGGEGRMIARAAVGPSNQEGSTHGVVEVHPDYRGRGLGSKLYDLVEGQARAQGTNTLMIESNQRHTLLHEFLARRGFEFDRYIWTMLLPPDQLVPAPTWPPGITVRTFVPGQDEQLYWRTFNDTFADHYAHTDMPLEHFVYISQRPSFDPAGAFFAFEGDKVAGMCIPLIRAGTEDEGWIDDLGVMPDYRRQGLGRALLLAGVNWLRTKVSTVKLGVEGKNQRALPLYTSVGFREHVGWVNMVKQLK